MKSLVQNAGTFIIASCRMGGSLIFVGDLRCQHTLLPLRQRAPYQFTRPQPRHTRLICGSTVHGQRQQQVKMHFDGQTFEPAHDLARLTSQLERVKAVMSGGGWFTLTELQRLCGGSEASLSARLRDCRKPAFGSWIVDRRRRGEPSRGLWEYRMRKREPMSTLFDMN